MAQFYDMLVYLRKRAGLSQQQLADALGMTRSAISMYETGKREPELEILEAFADFFNVDMNTLTGSERTPTTSGRRHVPKEDIMFALFRGNEKLITDEMYEEIQSFADYIASREAKKKTQKD